MKTTTSKMKNEIQHQKPVVFLCELSKAFEMRSQSLTIDCITGHLLNPD